MNQSKITVYCPNSACNKAMRIPLNKKIVFTCPHCSRKYETSNGEYFKRQSLITAKHINLATCLMVVLFGIWLLAKPPQKRNNNSSVSTDIYTSSIPVPAAKTPLFLPYSEHSKSAMPELDFELRSRDTKKDTSNWTEKLKDVYDVLDNTEKVYDILTDEESPMDQFKRKAKMNSSYYNPEYRGYNTRPSGFGRAWAFEKGLIIEKLKGCSCHGFP